MGSGPRTGLGELKLQGSLGLLADALESIRAHCIEGIEVDARRAESMVANSLMGVTARVPHIGDDRASRVAHHAHGHGRALRQAALEAGGVGEAEYDRRRMGGHASHVRAGMRRVHRLLARVPSIDAKVLRRLGLLAGRTHSAQAVQELLPLIDSRARFELNFRRNAP